MTLYFPIFEVFILSSLWFIFMIQWMLLVDILEVFYCDIVVNIVHIYNDIKIKSSVFIPKLLYMGWKVNSILFSSNVGFKCKAVTLGRKISYEEIFQVFDCDMSKRISIVFLCIILHFLLEYFRICTFIKSSLCRYNAIKLWK